jgi:signal transduction histidine kinase
MNWLNRFLADRDYNVFRQRHFWIIILIFIIITYIYYRLQFFNIVTFEDYPFTRDFATWEFVNNLVGSLFFIPIIYSTIRFWWRGAVIIWLLSLLIIFPRIVDFYGNNLGRIFNNIFYFSIPLLILSYTSFEMKWRKRERKISEEKEKERQDYIDKIFKAQEDERKRLAQEIHDDPIQRLAVIASDMQLLSKNRFNDDLPGMLNKIENTKDMIVSVSQDLRRISLDLRPPILDDFGLIPAIKWLLDNFKLETTVDTQIEVSGNSFSLSKKVSVNIFRIVQESLNNIKRHSKATSVKILVQFSDKAIKVSIQDNGTGFALPKTVSEFTTQGKLGIAGMQQRAQFINGNFVCLSEADKGTLISIEVSA